jgi:hypothetical protein
MTKKEIPHVSFLTAAAFVLTTPGCISYALIKSCGKGTGGIDDEPLLRKHLSSTE